MTYLVVVVIAVSLLALYIAWLAGRLARLHGRAEAARSALHVQLRKRAQVASLLAKDHALVLGSSAGPIEAAAYAALAHDNDREQSENELTRALRLLPLEPQDLLLAELVAVNSRLEVARQVYNDAIRDTLALRGQRVPRALRLAAHWPPPCYFDIDTEFVSALPRPRPSKMAA